MVQKLALVLLLFVSTSLAAWDLYPVPSTTGGSVRIRNAINYGDAGRIEHYNSNLYSSGHGKHTIDARFYTHNFELAMQIWGMKWSDGIDGGAQDLILSLRYNVLNMFNVFFDLDGLPWGNSNANTRYMKIGLQVGGAPTSGVYLGSEFAFKNPFNKELDRLPDNFTEYYDDTELMKIDQGGILDFSFEANFVKKRFIFFIGFDLEIQLNDTEFYEVYEDYYYYGYHNKEDYYYYGSGDALFQVNLGFSYAFTKSFSIEEENFLRLGNLRQSFLGHALNLKFNF